VLLKLVIVNVKVCVCRRVIKNFLKALCCCNEVEELFYKILMLCSLVTKHCRAGVAAWIPGIVAKWLKEHSKLIRCACVFLDLFDETGICKCHCTVSVTKFVGHVCTVCSDPVFSEVSCIREFFELIQNFKHLLVICKCCFVFI